MSKAFMKDLLKNKQEGNYFFSSIKTAWAKESLERSKEFVYSKHLNPSSSWMTWDGCPYDGIRQQAAGREAMEADKIQYLETGNFFHKGFGEWALKIPGLLWDKPTFTTSEENKKLEENWPEWPVYWKDYELSLRIDHVLNIKDEPCVVDLKIPQRASEVWSKYRTTLPEETHMCQAALGALALKRMGIVNPTRIGVLYFNPRITPKGVDGYKECYRPFDKEIEDRTMVLVEAAYLELTLFLQGKNEGCQYVGCKRHHGEAK
jgi:hypothetical protein